MEFEAVLIGLFCCSFRSDHFLLLAGWPSQHYHANRSTNRGTIKAIIRFVVQLYCPVIKEWNPYLILMLGTLHFSA